MSGPGERDMLLATLRDLDALRLPCPTCGGTQKVRKPSEVGGQHVNTYSQVSCPDCPDGRMSTEQAWKIVAAVFGGINIDPRLVTNNHEAGYVAAIEDLRGIR